MLLRLIVFILFIAPQFSLGDILVLNGEVNQSWIEKFEGVKGQVTHIKLNSSGGLNEVATDLAHRIRAQGGITTLVESASDHCESACVTVFMAGEHRYAHPNSQFLLHGVRFGSHGGLGNYGFLCVPLPIEGCEDLAENNRLRILELTQEYFTLLESFGLSLQVRERFFARALDPQWVENQNPSQILDWRFEAQELFDLGLRTAVKQKKPLK